MRAKGCIAVACACVLVAAIVASVLVLADMKGRASPSPSEASCSERGLSGFVDGFGALVSGDVWSEDGFPEIDWEWWQSANPDVIGWVTVPGTPVSHPVVQAPADSPDYYLTHDVYREWNFYGCPYLDADCAEGGLLESWNAVVLGHNMSLVDGGMFTAFSCYSDEGFAGEHSEILLQTPERKLRLQVVGSRVVEAASAEKRVEFSGEDDFRSYCERQLGDCDVRLVPSALSETYESGGVCESGGFRGTSMALEDSAVRRGGASEGGGGQRFGDGGASGADSADYARLFTFVTCSYTRFENERTLVFAVGDCRRIAD